MSQSSQSSRLGTSTIEALKFLFDSFADFYAEVGDKPRR